MDELSKIQDQMTTLFDSLESKMDQCIVNIELCQAALGVKGEESSSPPAPPQSLPVAEAKEIFRESYFMAKARAIACDNIHNCQGDAKHGGDHTATCSRLTAMIANALIAERESCARIAQDRADAEQLKLAGASSGLLVPIYGAVVAAATSIADAIRTGDTNG